VNRVEDLFIIRYLGFVFARLALFTDRVLKPYIDFFVVVYRAMVWFLRITEVFVEKYFGFVYEKAISYSNKVSDFCFQNKRITLVLFVCLNIIFSYGIKLKREGGILDRTIPPEDEYSQLDDYVRGKVGWEEFIPLFIKFPKGISSKEDLRKILNLTKKVDSWAKHQDFIVHGSVLSLASSHDFWKEEDKALEGGVLKHRAYINPETFAALDLDYWKSRVKSDSSVYGILVGKNWNWAAIVIHIKPGYDEYKVFWSFAEFVEERKISKIERLYKTDIYPKDPDIMVGSWVIGRATIYLTLPLVMYALISVGILLTFSLFRIILQDWPQALYATSMVGFSIMWVWGSIGIIDTFFGFPIRQRVYILAAFTNCIVQGVSFGLHKLKEYNRTCSWEGAKKVNALIFNTAVIAGFGFSTLWWFKIFSIRELGLLSALGVFYLYLLVTWFLPALAVFPPKSPGLTKLGVWYSSKVRFFGTLFSHLSKASALLYLIMVLLLASLAAEKIFLEKRLIIGSTPFEYIPNTHSEKTARFLNEPGRIGCDALNLLVEPTKKGLNGVETEESRLEFENGIYSARFVRSAYEFQESVMENVKQARRTVSVLNKVTMISQERYGRPLPENNDEVGSVFFLLEEEESFPDAVIEQQWFEKGIRVSVFAALNNSIEQGRFVEAVMEEARNYHDLKVSPFGKVPLYNREDKYIREGKPLNVISSQAVVVVFCFFIIVMKSKFIRSRKLSPWIGSLIMSVPFVFASSVMALIMVFFKIPLDVSTAIITALAINAAIDFSIYFVDSYQESLDKHSRDEAIDMAMKTEGEVITNDIILNSSSFSPLMVSLTAFIPIFRLGWMMIVMIISCGVGSLVIMPSILRHAVRKEVRLCEC
jgi:predicted RND superfamily exporter protein